MRYTGNRSEFLTTKQTLKHMSIYEDNIRKYDAEALTLAKTLKRLSVLRVLVFVVSAILIFILANERLLTPLLIAAPLCLFGFGLLIKRYYRIAYLKRHATFLKEINGQEVARQESRLTGFPGGQSYCKRDHAYTSDLDVFGSHSLFQLINRATTESGSMCLAEWLAAPASKEVILARQQAVKELTPKLDWRQDLQASGMHFHNPRSDYSKLLAWAEKPPHLLPHSTTYLLACTLLAVLSSVAAVTYLAHVYEANSWLYLLPLLAVLGVNNLILRKVKPVAEELLEYMHDNVKVLGGYEALIHKIASEKFQSPMLQQLQAVLSRDGYATAGEINRLRKILEVFEHRGVKGKPIGGNQLYPLLNNFWLLDIYCIILTEKWKARNRPYLQSWLTAVSEFEALSSIAGFSHANPSFTFPEITDAPYVIRFKQLGHPLLRQQSRVCNDFQLDGRGSIAMVTGSNMAGKSTFLRTVGANLVLALMGAPCCAAAGQVSNMKVFSSMRTQDNLEEGVSSFYAELRRIEQLLRLIESGEAVLFLLDEMFKGTNSKDRHRGGFSLIRQLKELNAFGIISTHDLELAILAGRHHLVSNYSFNSAIQEGEMHFNYALTPELCKDFNASELMKRSGIRILSHLEESM